MWTVNTHNHSYTEMSLQLLNGREELEEGEVDTAAPYSHDLLHTSQDDTGHIMRTLYKASRDRTASKRSISQPPSQRLRQYAARTALRQDFSRALPGEHHFCPIESVWKFGCASTWEEMPSNGDWCYFVDWRSCAQGRCSNFSIPQRSWQWRGESFLARMAQCQDNAVLRGRVREHLRYCPCPEQCRSIDLSRLHVPEDIRKYHPMREYFEEDI
jgi:hypothetical protein